jgi:hypothetical protein
MPVLRPLSSRSSGIWSTERAIPGSRRDDPLGTQVSWRSVCIRWLIRAAREATPAYEAD